MTPWPSKILLFFLRGYQLLFSSLMGRSCRYYPTCSSYTIQAVRRFGALRGALAGFCRILRCHPFHPGGYDPVPERFNHLFKFFSKKECICDTQKNNLSVIHKGPSPR